MKNLTLSQIAKSYGVSKMAITRLNLKTSNDGIKKIVDTDEPANAAILSAFVEKRKKKQTGKPTAPKPQTAKPPKVKTKTKTKPRKPPKPPVAPYYPPQYPPENAQLQIPEFSSVAEFDAYREKVRMQKEAALANKTGQTAVYEVEKLKLQIENQKLDIEKQKLLIAFETKKQEIQDGKYIATQIVQSLLEETIQAVISLENDIIVALNYNGELQGEKIRQLRDIFRDRQKNMAQKWQNLTAKKE